MSLGKEMIQFPTSGTVGFFVHYLKRRYDMTISENKYQPFAYLSGPEGYFNLTIYLFSL